MNLNTAKKILQNEFYFNYLDLHKIRALSDNINVKLACSKVMEYIIRVDRKKLMEVQK